jgi:hypothetical protein
MLPAPDERWSAWETSGKGLLSLRHFMERIVKEKFVMVLLVLGNLIEVFLVDFWHLHSWISLQEFVIQISRIPLSNWGSGVRSYSISLLRTYFNP